jgi:hypothetical protein
MCFLRRLQTVPTPMLMRSIIMLDRGTANVLLQD